MLSHGYYNKFIMEKIDFIRKKHDDYQTNYFLHETSPYMILGLVSSH